MAGLWAVWKDPESGLWVPSAAVITTEANRLVGRSTTACPCCCRARPGTTGSIPAVDDPEYLLSLLEPAPDDVLEMYPISTAVNDVRNEGPDLLRPVEAAPLVEAPQLPFE